MIDKQQDFLTLTGAARRARSEGYDITYHGLRNLVGAGYICKVPTGSRVGGGSAGVGGWLARGVGGGPGWLSPVCPLAVLCSSFRAGCMSFIHASSLISQPRPTE